MMPDDSTVCTSAWASLSLHTDYLYFADRTM